MSTAPRPTGDDLLKLLVCSNRHMQSLKNKIEMKRVVTKDYFSIANIGFLEHFFLK